MNGRRRDLTQADVRELLDYDPDTGSLTWKPRPIKSFSSAQSWAVWNARYAHKEAGNITKTGYRKIAIGAYPYAAHRIIWLWAHGRWPNHIDHVDGCRSNNKLANLRDVTPAENHKNVRRKVTNTSGITGVTKVRGGKWLAYIRVNYKRMDLGRFASKEEAVSRRKAAERVYGFHSNHGRAA